MNYKQICLVFERDDEYDKKAFENEDDAIAYCQENPDYVWKYIRLYEDSNTKY